MHTPRRHLAAIGTAVLLAAALAACDSHVRRRAVLAFTNGLPRAATMLVGDTLHLELSQLEHLEAGLEFVAWARMGSSWVRLGEVEPGQPAMFAAQTVGVDWAGVAEIVVSEESATSPPQSPTGTIHFSGGPGESLHFAGDTGPTAADFQGANAVANIEDYTLRLTYAGLPELGFGRSYGVWLLPGDHDETAGGGGGHDEGDGHQHKPDDAHGGAAAAEAMFLGKLDLTGSSEWTKEVLLATYGEVIVSVELDNGHHEVALGSVVMRGHIPHEVVAGAGGATHEEEAGHSH